MACIPDHLCLRQRGERGGGDECRCRSHKANARSFARARRRLARLVLTQGKRVCHRAIARRRVVLAVCIRRATRRVIIVRSACYSLRNESLRRRIRRGEHHRRHQRRVSLAVRAVPRAVARARRARRVPRARQG